MANIPALSNHIVPETSQIVVLFLNVKEATVLIRWWQLIDFLFMLQLAQNQRCQLLRFCLQK